MVSETLGIFFFSILIFLEKKIANSYFLGKDKSVGYVQEEMS